jgi:hypothetical protein
MFSDTDIQSAIAYNSQAVFEFYSFTASGAIRFDLRRFHVDELNARMQTQLASAEDVERFKKQMRTAIRAAATA